jgi:hypothetical protein
LAVSDRDDYNDDASPPPLLIEPDDSRGAEVPGDDATFSFLVVLSRRQRRPGRKKCGIF